MECLAVTVRRRFFPFLIICSLVCGITGFAIGGSLPAAFSQGVVAEVGTGRVTAEQVFELWGPVWYETLTKVRTGKMSASEGDAKLQREWQVAGTAMIRDELLYQEAEREHDSKINHYADMIYRQMQQGSSSGYPMSRAEIAKKIRDEQRQHMERVFREMTAELVKGSGGMVKLRKVLEGRGLSFRDWQDRLRKKAFTRSYLNLIIGPRAPAPGPKAIQSYYAEHPDEFAVSGVVKFRHVFFSAGQRGGMEAAREAVSEVWEMLMDGEITLEEAAARYSDDKVSAARGGLETTMPATDPEREAWLADIRTALREETPGELGPILESPFGFHLAILISIDPETKVPFREVRKDIERKLENEKFQEEVDKYFAVVRRNTNIRVLMPQFPPELSCSAQQVRPTDVPSVYKMGEVGLPGL